MENGKQRRDGGAGSPRQRAFEFLPDPHGSIWLAAFTVLLLYLSTLGPHLGHHLTDLSPRESECTVLSITDGTYSGLLDGGLPTLPGLQPGPALPITAALVTSPEGCFSPKPRGPPTQLP